MLLRGLFFLLVLVNLALFAWGQGYLGTRSDGREPQRLLDQLDPEKLKVGQPPPAPASAPPRQACLRVEGLASADAERLQKGLQEGGLATSLAAAGEALHRVSIGPLANRAAAERKAGELRQLGVADFQLVPAEAGAFSILLGTAASEAGANELLQKLARKGVRSAHADAPAAATATLEASGAEDILTRRLAELLGTSPATVVDCR